MLISHRGAALTLLAAFFLASACDDGGGGEFSIDPDPDGDGLTNQQEEVFETDPDVADSDGDGLHDGEEFALGTDPNDPDTDDDLLGDAEEVAAGTNPFDSDSDDGGVMDGPEVEEGRDPLDVIDDFDFDSDGLTDEQETDVYGTDPRDPDTDGDDLSDYEEIFVTGTDPLNPDSDGDGILDGEDVAGGGDPLSEDSDGDGLTDAEERELGTNPSSDDTDRDGLTDPHEVNVYLTDPLDADSDDDTLLDGREVHAVGSDPLDPDGDGDGLTDPDEFAAGTNPMRADTDGDRLSDPDEIAIHGTNPLLSDTDTDGLQDGIEVLGDAVLEPYGATDPNDSDSDSDGLPDGIEVERGVSPNEPDSDGDGLVDGAEVYDFLTDPALTDTDADGLTDDREIDQRTNPMRRDTDGDGLDDGLEVDGIEGRLPGGGTATYFADPLVADTDGDGLFDLEEAYRFGTDPSLSDTDEDTLLDREEVAHGFDPLTGGDGVADLDGDGLTNREELDWNTRPRMADTDADGLLDGAEIDAGTYPDLPDSDGDNLGDGDEVAAGLDPLAVDTDLDGIDDGDEPGALFDNDGDGLTGAADPDTDGDGLGDLEELETYLTGVLTSDTDGDRIPDGVEVDWGYDPLDASDAVRDDDGDGLTAVQEYRFRTDPTLVDSDGDDIPDGVEVLSGMNPDGAADGLADFDGDGIPNRDELCPEGASGGACEGDSTNIRSSDSDGDGLADSLDTVPNVGDRDGDGLLDGVEVYVHGTDPDSSDSDGDGLSDSEELSAGSHPWNPDADGDGLLDVAEREEGTDPTTSDTDGDGLDDFAETRGGFRVRRLGVEGRVEVFTSPFLRDTDGDGLDDAVEVAAGIDPTLADSDDDGLNDLVERDFGTDALDPDTDADGIPDGFDPSPLGRDADADGIPDSAELVEGFNARIVAVGAAAPLRRDLDVSELFLRDWLRIVVRVAPTTADPESRGAVGTARLRVAAEGVSIDSTHAVREVGDALIATAYFRTTSDSVRVDVDVDAGAFVVEEIVVESASTGSGRPLRAFSTFADRADSDADGVTDADEAGAGFWVDTDTDGINDRYVPGFWVDVNEDRVRTADEGSRGFWLEAEHYADPTLPRMDDPLAGGGSVVVEERGRNIFESGSGAWGYVPGATYSVFVRGQVLSNDPDDIDVPGCTNESCPNTPWVTVDLGGGTGEGCTDGRCARRVTFTNTLEWRYAGTYTPDGRFDIRMQELLAADGLWALDRVAILPFVFTPATDVPVAAAAIPAERRVSGVDSGTIYLDADLPWGVSDPMEADTDGDGYRSVAANCETDPVTCPAGEIPGSIGLLTDGMELRTLRSNSFDIDSDRDADLYPSTGAAPHWFGNGVIDLFGLVGPLPLYTDAWDTYPVGTDRDLDGIDNSIEIELWASCRAGYVGDLVCPDPRAATTACDELSPGAGEVLCWVADDDRDNDGLPDGIEDANQNGLLDPGELDPNDPDTDGDGISDGVEVGLGVAIAFNNRTTDALWDAFTPDAQPATTTNPRDSDSDGDGLDDGEEDLDGNGSFVLDTCPGGTLPSCGDRTITHSETGAVLTYATPTQALCETDPSVSDTDEDGLTDREERLVYCTDPLSPDSDLDGLSDALEVEALLTDPNVADTDGDGLDDGEEVDLFGGVALSDPLRPDTDGDGLDDFEEVLGTTPSNPRLTDSDGDGLDDFEEVTGAPATDPMRSDTDGDGLSDLFEQYGEDANRNGTLDAGEDLDGDGLLTTIDTDPTNADSDSDFFRDGEEYRSGTDPNDPTDQPSSLDDAGGLTVDVEGSDVTYETNPGTGERTGVISLAGDQIMLACPGRQPTAFVDGTLTIDRSDPTVPQTVVANGTVYARLPGGLEMPVWLGETTFVGFDAATGEPTNSALAYPVDESLVQPLNMGSGTSATVELNADIFFDICEGEIGGQASWRLGDDSWGIGAESTVGLRPASLGFSAEGLVHLDTPIGTAYLTRAELEASLLEFYAAGSAGVQIPTLGDALGLFPELEDDVDADSSDCPICFEFLIDPLNGRFRFTPESGYEMSVGPATVSVDGPEFPLPEFELDIPRGLVHIVAGFEAKNLEFEADVTFDLAGQVVYEPALDFPEPDDCTSDSDCRFGQFCDSGQCAGCAQRFTPEILDRYDIEIADVGETGGTFALALSGEVYSCPGGGVDCDEDERALLRSWAREVSVIQNGLLDEDDISARLVDEITAISAGGCENTCTDNYSDCADFECPIECFFNPFADDCDTCAEPVCGPLRTACLDTCDEVIELEAYDERGALIIEADSFLVDLTVEATYNGVEDEDTVGAEEAENANGHLSVSVSTSIPLKNPIVSLDLSGTLFGDLFPVSLDGDPNFFAVNGNVGLSASGGPVTLGIEIGSAMCQLSLNASDEVDYILIASDQGVRLDDFVGGLPGGLGNIGSGQTMLFGFDVETSTLCGEGDFAVAGFTIPWAFEVAPPITPDGELDTSAGGVFGGFGIVLPLWFGYVEGTGAVDWEGNIAFDAELDLELIPGVQLAGAEFHLDNDGAELSGNLELPAGLGFLDASGAVTWDGQFDLALDGAITVAGFELASVSGSASNSGIELFASVEIPGLGGVEVEGWVREDGDFYFSGVVDIDLPGGGSLADASVVLSNDGLSINASLSLPGVTEIHVSGQVLSTGYIQLVGSGSIGFADGLQLGPVTLSFERQTDGTITIAGSGGITVGGHTIVDMNFSFGTDGSFSASGRIDMWVAEASVSVSKPAGGSLTMEASVSVSVSAFSHTVFGNVTLVYSAGVLTFELSAGISGPILDASFMLTVSSNGCFSVSGVGRFCL